MKTTCEFLDDVKARHSLPSDYALSKLLDVKPQTVQQYRNGRLLLSDSMAIKVAGLLEIDQAAVVLSIHAQRATKPEEKAAWESILQRLGGAAAALVLGLGLSALPSPSEAAGGGQFDNNLSHPIHYATLRRRRKAKSSGFAIALGNLTPRPA